MNLFKRAQYLFMVCLIAVFVVSCTSSGILIRPPADGVKKFALVSVSANRGVRNQDGEGTIGGIMAITSMVKSATEDEGDKKKDDGFDFGGNALVDYGAETFESEFSTIEGWSLVTSSEFMNTDAYQQFKKDMEAYVKSTGLSFLHKMGSLSARGMPPVPNHGTVEQETQMLTELAQKLGVDAVAVIDFDMAYSAYTAIGGSGTANAVVGIRLVMVDKNGEFVIQTPAGVDYYTRVGSDNATGMVAGSIIYSPAAEAIFKESIKKGLVSIRDQINTELMQE